MRFFFFNVSNKRECFGSPFMFNACPSMFNVHAYGGYNVKNGNFYTLLNKLNIVLICIPTVFNLRWQVSSVITAVL